MCFFKRSRSKAPMVYKLEASLDGHTDGIYSLSITRGGQLLASGGSDGVKLWDLKTRAQLRASLPDYNCAQRGPVTCVLWVTRRDEKQELLAFGTLTGYVVIWTQTSRTGFIELAANRVGTGSQITCIADDRHGSDNRRLAIGARDRRILVVELDSKGELLPIFSVTMEKTVPSGLTFVDYEDRNVYVFGHYDGDLHLLRGSDGKVLSSRNVGTPVASVAVNHRRGHILVDNTIDGMTLLELESASFIRSFRTGTPKKRVPKQVAFGEDGKVVVGGSDHSAVYVFDRKTGVIRDVLHHDQDLVQAITRMEQTHTGNNNASTIACATTALNCDNKISVWVYKPEKVSSNMDWQLSMRLLFDQLMQWLGLMVVVTFIYRNLDVMSYVTSLRPAGWSPILRFSSFGFVLDHMASDSRNDQEMEIEALKRMIEAMNMDRQMNVMNMERGVNTLAIDSGKEKKNAGAQAKEVRTTRTPVRKRRDVIFL